MLAGISFPAKILAVLLVIAGIICPVGGIC